MAGINHKYTPKPGELTPHHPVAPRVDLPLPPPGITLFKRERVFVEEWLSGEEVTTASGAH